MRAKYPQYKKIENELLEKITSGFYRKGEAIPTEKELSEYYRVSRVTIRKATDGLMNMGLLKRIPGSGTYIQDNTIRHKMSYQIGFSEEMEKMRMESKTVVKSFCIIEADAKIASILGINEGERVYYFERVRYGNNEILMFEQTYMATKYFPDISIKYLENSKYDYIEKVHGAKIDYSLHQTIPILPSPEIAELFNININTPIIKVGNTTFLKDGRVMDFTNQYMNSPKYQLNYIRYRK